MITEVIYRPGVLCLEIRGHITYAVTEAVAMAARMFPHGDGPYRLTMIDHYPPEWEALVSHGITRFVFQSKEEWEKDQKEGEELMAAVRKSFGSLLKSLNDGEANDN